MDQARRDEGDVPHRTLLPRGSSSGSFNLVEEKEQETVDGADTAEDPVNDDEQELVAEGTYCSQLLVLKNYFHCLICFNRSQSSYDNWCSPTVLSVFCSAH